MRKTMLTKYGVENPMHHRDLSLKNAKSQNNSYVLYHWKTNEQIICQGSYERKVVEYFNKNKIEYQWQPKIFTMPNGKKCPHSTSKRS